MRLILVALSALALAGCGSSGDSSDDSSPERKPTQSTPTATPTPDPDADGDGTPDSRDFDPQDDKVQSKADSLDCDVRGINRKGVKEGNCIDAKGRKVQVVNRDTQLTLKQLSVKLNSIAHTDTIPREFDSPLVGSFVVANVTLTNRLNAPVETDATNQFALSLGNRIYTPDFDAMNNGDSKLIYETLQPDESAAGDVVFRVTAKRARELDRTGNLLVLQWSDVENGLNARPEVRMGVIRTYH